MISFVEKDTDRQLLLRLCKKTAYGCKIAALAAAYGFEKSFVCFWLDAKNKVVFCQTDGDMIISGTVLDREETEAFLRAAGPTGILCAVKNAETLALPITQSGDILKKQLPQGSATKFDPAAVNIRDMYNLLEENGMVDEFEPFYLDLSHKLRHGTAMAFIQRTEKTLAGCAVVSAISEDAAILSAVAVKEEFRRQGIGTALIRQAEAALPGKTMYVFREKEKNREFYRQLGYAKTDTWVYSKK